MFFNALCTFVFSFVYSVFLFVLFSVLFLLLYIAVSFLFLYSFIDHCHRVETPNAVNKCYLILMMVMMMMMMRSLTSRDEIFMVEQEGISCVLLCHTCLYYVYTCSCLFVF